MSCFRKLPHGITQAKPLVGDHRDAHWDARYWVLESSTDPLRAAMMMPLQRQSLYIDPDVPLYLQEARRLFHANPPSLDRPLPRAMRYDIRLRRCASSLKRRRTGLRLA